MHARCPSVSLAYVHFHILIFSPFQTFISEITTYSVEPISNWNSVSRYTHRRLLNSSVIITDKLTTKFTFYETWINTLHWSQVEARSKWASSRSKWASSSHASVNWSSRWSSRWRSRWRSRRPEMLFRRCSTHSSQRMRTWRPGYVDRFTGYIIHTWTLNICFTSN